MGLPADFVGDEALFAALTHPWQRLWLVALLVLWAILLFGGFLSGKGTTGHRTPTWARLGSSFTLVVAAWSWYAFGRTSPVATFSLLVALGMSLGFIGDLFMAGLLGGGRSVLGGMGAFGLGHIFYISAFVWLSSRLEVEAAVARWATLVVWLLIGLVGWYFVVFRGQKATTLHWVALPYALLLASTAGFATGLAWQTAGFTPLAIGAALFLLSDLLIAAQLFNGLNFPLIHDVIWLTYGPAQMLIVYATGTAFNLAAALL